MEPVLPLLSALRERGSPAPPGRISSVKAHILTAPLQQRFGWSLRWTASRSATLVEVTTDDGLTGWGEGAFGRELLTRSPEIVLGRSPFEVEAIYNELRVPAAEQRRLGEPTAPGLDVALWDLAGKALGVPVSRLLGRQYRNRVQVYCTALYRKDWPDLAEGLAEEARGWKAAGFTAMKMKVGFDPELDLRIVRAVREAIGAGTGLAVDANCAYDAGTALALGRRLEEFDPLWWEEPLPAGDLAGYARLKQALRIPLAAGETGSLDRVIRDYIQPRAVDIVQPDVEVAGLTGARVLSYLCWLNHLRLIPHNWGTALRTAATLHWMSACPPLTGALVAQPALMELDQTENPLRELLTRPALAMDPADCSIAVPTGPGLGVEVIREAVEEFRAGLVEIG
ncbi:MAG: mandelate racemase/muconate lactonizing enzyme family protein [Acidobacteriota bacterium]|mgnify:CR=1 FL=1